MAVVVEIGFNANTAGQLFTLDDLTKGVLDSAYVLDGVTWTDVTAYATSISTNRGKSRELDRFNAGSLNVVFNNKGRLFDPTYTSSPYYGQIVPRKPVRYSVDGLVQFVGVIDDWNLSYTIDGDSNASLTAYDGFTSFSNQTLSPQTYTSQLSGDRIKAILSDPNVGWGLTNINIDAGKQMLQADTVASGVDALGYINTVEDTEFGMFFIDRQGNATWKQVDQISSSTPPVFSDTGVGIGYSDVQIVYGSELLYNQIVLSRVSGGTATANALVSQASYGIRNMTLSGLLNTSDNSLAILSAYYANSFKDPEYRFESLEFPLHKMSPTDRAVLLAMDIGDTATVIFTPNNIAPSISKSAQVIGVDHNTTFHGEHVVKLKFQTNNRLVNYGVFILDDPISGVLDLYMLS
jgi:hypothetical protein